MSPLELLASGDVAKLLNISRQRLDKLVKIYDIPFYQTSAGRIFLKADIQAFQKSRKDKTQYGWKKLKPIPKEESCD